MDDNPEISESGQPILRHKPRETGFELAVGDTDTIKHVSEHIERHIGNIDNVFHEILSDLVHVDIHTVAPSEQRPYYTLVTSGMSDRPMTVPPGAEEFAYAELMLCLPPTWSVRQEDFKREENYWPIRWLKTLARLPHEYQTWLGFGHTVPNGDPPAPFAGNTKMCGVVLAPPLRIPSAFHEMTISGDRTVHFYAMLPLYREEMDFKLKRGADALLEKFDGVGMTELLDPARKNVCKNPLWPFR